MFGDLGWSRERGSSTNNRSADGVQQLGGTRPFGASLLGGCADEDERSTNLRAARPPTVIVVDYLGADRRRRRVLPRVFGDGRSLLVLGLRL